MAMFERRHLLSTVTTAPPLPCMSRCAELLPVILNGTRKSRHAAPCPAHCWPWGLSWIGVCGRDRSAGTQTSMGSACAWLHSNKQTPSGDAAARLGTCSTVNGIIVSSLRCWLGRFVLAP